MAVDDHGRDGGAAGARDEGAGAERREASRRESLTDTVAPGCLRECQGTPKGS